jgi:hypothetical protein
MRTSLALVRNNVKPATHTKQLLTLQTLFCCYYSFTLPKLLSTAHRFTDAIQRHPNM